MTIEEQRGIPVLSEQKCYHSECAVTELTLGFALATCQKCTRHFCPSHSSKFSSNFCQDCLSDVIVSEKTYTKTTEEWDELTDTIISTPKGCKRINFAGTDWVFHTRAIDSMTDEELKASFQFHKAVVSQMELEMTQRSVKKQAAIRMSEGNIIRTRTVTEVTKTKTTKVKRIDIKDLASKLKAAGFTLADVESLLKQQQKGAEQP